MKRLVGSITVSLVLAAAAAAGAQEKKGFVQGSGGFATNSEATSGDVALQGGVRVAPHLVVFGDIGRLTNVQPSDAQPAVDTAVSALAANNLTITGDAHVPAWYTAGGVRLEIPTRTLVTPYVFGAVGYARVNPSARFQYSGGTTLSGATATAGEDATTDVINAGYFTVPASSSGVISRFGGGVQIPIGRMLVGDIGYAFSRIATDTPVTANSVTFGVGVRF
ncbi:MAG: hypothetical protein DMF86_19185 [Acidobacteria bacterium]|nr:MAG: hypothetical protein DMF86_19185 [Acidobacteriota bacterium]